ncbi:tetratricopeptide repeat protein [Massilia sp. S19_KUP03_FR1]|uniref:tetratricopeptide repeat protein n=1 Tax=Massilia sp. S19_KUP03_FR1 TaxID=3025503 RepID=UPI002FCD7792
MTWPGLGADDAYLMGRQHQLARSNAEAIRLYRTALLTDPQHLNARNGLATALAEQGDLKAAIALWEGLTAQFDRAAWLFSNLGYAYYLDGQYGAAQQVQQRACLLDPANAQAWQRLSATLEKIGDLARALRMQRQGLALLKHDVRADAALADTPDDDWAKVTLVTGADGLLTLQRSDVAPVSVPASATLDIANGNGVPGAARATARRVRDPALRVVRLSNEVGFGVRRTRIEYRPALLGTAQRLAQQVAPDAVLVEAPPGLTTSLRLVLGRN